MRIGGLPQSGNAMGREIGEVLGVISQQELKEGRHMLSAVCIGTSGVPGEGFFNLAKQLSVMTDDSKPGRDRFWRKQLEKAYESWAVGSRK